MRRRMLTVVAILLLGGVVVDPAAGAEMNAAPPVVPRLTSWTGGQGAAVLTAGSRIVVDSVTAEETTVGPTSQGLSQRTLRQVATTVAADLTTVTGRVYPITEGAARAGDIVVGLAATAGAGAEGYRLEVGNQITITANTSAGVFYGSRTMLQILRQDPAHATLPRGVTTDAPAKPIRMFTLDLGRKFWEPGDIDNVIRQLGWTKQNVLMMHIADAEGFRLNSPAFPGLADPASSYTKEQIQHFIELGAENNVQVIPAFEFPGHAQTTSDYFKIGFGDGPNADGSGATADNTCGQQYTYGWVKPGFTINLTNPRALTVTKQVLNEFLPWFSSPYVQIGGDEVPPGLAACPALKKYIAANPDRFSTLGDVLSDYINAVDAHLTQAGKRTVIYNGFEHMSRPKQTVNTDVIVMDWEGDGSGPALAAYDRIQSGPNRKLYLTPNNYHKAYPDQDWIYRQWQPAPDGKLLGGGIHVWNDYNMWAQDKFLEDLAAVPRAMTGDRLWNATVPTDSTAAFATRLARIGTPPGYTGFATPPRKNDGTPIHFYPMKPGPYPVGWTDAAPAPNVRPVLDTAGKLPGSTYIVTVPKFVSDPVRGSALRFAGSGDGVGFGGVDIAEPWTFSTWVRRTADNRDATLLSAPTGAIKLQQWKTQARFGITRFGVADYSFNYTVPLNTWVHITLVATPGRTTLYADGVQQGVVNASIPLPMQALGQKNGSTLNGDISDMAIYDQAATPQQVAAQHRDSSPGRVPVLAG